MRARTKDEAREIEHQALALLSNRSGALAAAMVAYEGCAEHREPSQTILIDGDGCVTVHCRSCSIEGEPLDDVRRILETERGPIALVMLGGKTVVVMVRPRCVCGGDVGRVEDGEIVCSRCGQHAKAESLAS